MRIGIVTPGFSSSESDWCIPAFLDLVRLLAQEHDVRVLALRYPHREDTYSVYGAEVRALGGRETRGLRRLSLARAALAALASDHQRRSFDVLHGLFAHEPGFVAVTAAARLGVPAVVSVLGGELASIPEIGYGGLTSRANRWLVQRALDRAHRVTVGSSALHHLVASRIAAHRITRWSLGVDTALFRPRDEAAPGLNRHLQGGVKLLSVASHTAVKDLSSLIRAAAALRPTVEGLHLHLVGDGSQRPAHERLAGQLDIADRVTFHGEVPHERLPWFYHQADLCVLSSLSEAQPLVVLEAAACGRTTVGTRVGPLPELLPKEWLAEPGDSDSLAAAIATSLANRERLARFSARLRERVVAEHSLQRSVDQLLGLYGSVAAHERAIDS